MVKRRTRQMYVDDEFFQLSNTLKAEIMRTTGKRVANTDVTRDITEFLEHEKLIPIMVNRVKKKRRFFL